ncbi:MAG: hypothetical protein ACOYD0_07020 [Candidatus Nanopelagicales bacterium]
MNTMFRVQYLARKSLLSVFGPADLDDHNDPKKKLERDRDERLGPRPTKIPHVHIPKRHFHSGHIAA